MSPSAGAAVAVLYIGGVDERMHQKALRIDEDMALLPLILARVIAGGIDLAPPFSRLLTLWLSIIAAVGLVSRPSFRGRPRKALHAHEGAIPVPQVEIVIDCGARRQILRDRPPLAASTQHVKQRIDDFPQVHPALVAATFGRRDERSDKSPFLVRQITGIPQITAVIATAVLVPLLGSQVLRSHRGRAHPGDSSA